jgi:hypothetical protein
MAQMPKTSPLVPQLPSLLSVLLKMPPLPLVPHRAEVLAAATGQLAALKELGELSALEQLLARDWVRAMSAGHLRRPQHSWGRAVFPLHPEEISARIVPLHAVQPKRDPYHPYPCSEFCLAARMRQALRPGWVRCREPLRCSVGLPCLQLMTAYAALAKPSSADPAHGNSTVTQ